MLPATKEAVFQRADKRFCCFQSHYALRARTTALAGTLGLSSIPHNAMLRLRPFSVHIRLYNTHVHRSFMTSLQRAGLPAGKIKSAKTKKK